MLGWCAETTLVAAGLAVLALGAGRWFRLAPEARHALWLVVLVKFLVPPVIAWPWAASDRPSSVAPMITQTAPMPVPPALGPLPVPPQALVEPPPPEPLVDLTRTEIPEPFPDPVDPELAAPPAVVDLAMPRLEAFRPEPVVIEPSVVAPVPALRFGWRWLVLAGWLVGTVVVAVRGAVRIARFRQTLRAATPAPAWLGDEVAAVAGRLGVVRPPPVRVAAGLATPLLWCLGRPVLVVPATIDRLTPDARSGLLAHELAHLARWDHWVVRLELLAGLVWWWNPVFRSARRRLRDEAEQSCDARVVRAFPSHRFAYAEALIQVCEHHARPAPPLPALGIGGAWAARTLEARLTMILRDPIRPPSRWLPLIALTLLALALPSWTLGRQDPAPPTDPPKAEAPKVENPAPPESPQPIEATVREAVEDPTKQRRDVINPPEPSQPAQQGAKDNNQPTEVEPARLPGRIDRSRADGNSAARFQARRNIQAAEVARAEAERDRLKAKADHDAARAKLMIISQSVADDAQASLKVAEAVVAIEKAKLAEVDLTLDPADPAPALTSRRDPGELSVLQARRAIQTAEVQRVEAQLRLVEAVLARNNSINKRIPTSVSREEIQKAEGELVVAQAEVAREKARLTEADALLTQANPVPVRQPNRDRGEIVILQARRAAQAAEVQRVEAERDQAKLEAKNTDELVRGRGVSPRESALYQIKLKAAEAAVAREQAKLAEANAMLDQVKAPQAADPSEAVAGGKPVVALGDYRDLVDLAEMQVQFKQVELHQAETKADRAKKYLDARASMAREGRITQTEWANTQSDHSQAQYEVSLKQIEVREAELRLKQAKRRAYSEEAQLKRLAERAKDRLDWSRKMFQKGYVSAATFRQDRDQYDDLMFQLDPNYQPEPESPANPASPSPPSNSP